MTAQYPSVNYPPPGPPTPPARPVSTPWYKRAWVIGVAAGVVGIGIGGAAAASDKKNAQGKPGPTVTATATVVSTAPAPPAATRTLKPTVIRTIATKVKTKTVTYHPPVKVAFSDGEFIVGDEIRAGQYHTEPDGSSCYWEIDGRSADDIIQNGNADGPTTIDIPRSAYKFTSEGGCDWVRR